MFKRHYWLLLLLLPALAQLPGGCAGLSGDRPALPPAPAAVERAVQAGLPPLAELRAGRTLRATSTLSLSVDGWQGPAACTASAVRDGTAVRLASAPGGFSAAWYGVRPTFNSLTVPYLPPYEVTLRTGGGGEYWIALADFRQGNWAIAPAPFTGTDVTLPVTLDSNAADAQGFFFLAVITCGGQSLRVDSLDLRYPDVPAAGSPVDYHQWVVAQDGTRLATDVYLPYAGSGAPAALHYPVLLLRTPYPKDGDAWAQSLAAQKIAVVIQYFRGRLSTTPGWPNSEGAPCLLRDHAGPDHTDGLDTAAWLEGRAWYNGTLVLQGFSAQGLAACQETTMLGNRLAGLYSKAACGDFGDFSARRNGCFKQSIIPNWIANNGFPPSLTTEALQGFARGGYYEQVDFDRRAAGVGCPGFHMTGWWDIDVEATINTWKQFGTLGQGAARGNQWLLIGPWIHSTDYPTSAGQLDFPTGAGELHNPHAVPYTWEGMNFVLSALGRDPAYMAPQKRVRAYFVGEEGNTTAPQNTWYELDDWPPPYNAQTLWLDGSRMLAGAAPAPATLSWDCDPLNPLPTVGGANSGILSGPYDQRVIPESSAVLKFSTAPLGGARSFAGPFNCVLFVSTDRADTDVMAKLVDVYPDGRELLFADSAVRLSWYLEQQGLGPVVPGEIYEVHLEIEQRAYVCAAGHRLELWLQGSNFPRFAVNPGNGDAFLDGTGSNAETQHCTLSLGSGTESRLILPDFDPSA